MPVTSNFLFACSLSALLLLASCAPRTSRSPFLKSDTALSRYITIGWTRKDPSHGTRPWSLYYRPDTLIKDTTHISRPWLNNGVIIGQRRNWAARPARHNGLFLTLGNTKDTVNGLTAGLFSARVENGLVASPFIAACQRGAAVGLVSSLQGELRSSHLISHKPEYYLPSAGLAIGAFGAIAGSNASGVVIGGIFTFAGGDQPFNGLAISAFNFGNNFHGLQVGIINSEMEEFRGLENQMNGVQLALFNSNWHTNGLQMGVVNHTTYGKCIQIGLINIIRSNTRHRWLPLINWPTRGKREVKRRRRR